MQTQCPYTENVGSVMSNFDHEVDAGAEESLRSREVYGDYAGWNFHGRVWWDRASSEFCCEPWTHHYPRAIIRAATLPELMEAVSDEYGND